MTIEEVEELRKQELNNTLRFPETSLDENGRQHAFYVAWCVHGLVNDKNFISRLLNKRTLQKQGIEVSGKGTNENPYIIKSPYGDGKFFNVKYVFKNKRCPFKVGLCFSNAFNMASEMYKLEGVDHCDCVSGILLTQKGGKQRSILHSVVELNNKWVVDVNCGMVISKDLYYKLFMFEELARFPGAEAQEMYEILETQKAKDVIKRFNLRTYHMAFAMDDLKDFIEDYSRQERHQEFADLNY